MQVGGAGGRRPGGRRPIHTADLVISLRSFIRDALDLGPIPGDIAIPLQGPTRTQGSGGRGRGDNGKPGNRGGGGGGGGRMGEGAGMGMGLGLGLGVQQGDHDRAP